LIVAGQRTPQLPSQGQQLAAEEGGAIGIIGPQRLRPAR
jgi:hypothetical protein